MRDRPEPPAALSDILFDAFETVDEGIAIYDHDERLVHCNQRYRDQLEPVAEMLRPGMAWRDLERVCAAAGIISGLRDDDIDWRAACDELRASTVQQSAIRQSGDRTYELTYHPTPSGGFVVTRADVTDRVRAEAEAEHHAALLTRILETNPIPVVMARLADSRIVWRSPAAQELIGDVEFARDSYQDPAVRNEYVALLKRHGKVEDFRSLCRSADGSVVSVALSGMLTEFGGETCVVSSITDLTEVLEREALIRQVVEACPAPVLMVRAESGEILYRSSELIALLGDGMDTRKFYVDPRDRAGFLEILRKKGDVTDYRERLLNASGQPFWAAVSGTLTEWNGEEVIVTFTRDLTHQLEMEAELDRQREQMFQNEKLSALGGLLAGVAHELNNPLSVVVGHAMMLQEESEDENTRRQTRKISEAAERCARIVKTFLSMARQEPARMEAVDINEIAQIAVEVARYGDDARATRIELVLGNDLPEIAGDADQLTQVVVNLILNAEQAIAASETGNTIRVSTAADTNGAALTVDDNGPGVPAEIRKRVFEPFFTTKGVGQGTGIGLSMCHRIVSAHGGAIRVEDVPTGGARFVVSLPANSSDSARTQHAIEDADTMLAPCRVLVIDDEQDVAELNVEVLNRSGYDAKAAFSVQQALEILDTTRFDVILSDLNMPGMDGRALFEAISRHHPSLEAGIGFITGDTLGKTSQSFLAEADRPYLEKPVSPRELREFVSRLCQRSGS